MYLPPVHPAVRTLVAVLVVLQVAQDGRVNAYVEVVTLERTYRVDACTHVPAMQVALPNPMFPLSERLLVNCIL